jgi:hypothetical protein
MHNANEKCVHNVSRKISREGTVRRHTDRLEDNIKLKLKNIHESEKCIYLAQDK